jgi:hypothetical protein
VSLSASERVDVRRFAGYGAIAPTPPDALEAAMDNVTAEAETIIRSNLLPALRTMETALTASVTSIDTASAAVWTRNAAALAEYSMLFRNQRLMLCRFVNVDPGLGIYDPLLVIPDPTSVGDGGSGGGTDPGGLSFIPAVFTV